MMKLIHLLLLVSPLSRPSSDPSCAAGYGDNLAGSSFEGRLCMPKIDVVYTWVNGSDPKLIEGCTLIVYKPPLFLC